MSISRIIEAGTPGEELARRLVHRAGYLFTAAPVLAVLITLVFGFHWPVLALLSYILVLTAAEGVAGVAYLVVLKLDLAGGAHDRGAVTAPA